MKKYFVNYGDFANQYSLFYVENPTDERYAARKFPNAERIPKKRAVELAQLERFRRQSNQAFSGYADDIILPAQYHGFASWGLDYGVLRRNGRILERTGLVGD